MKVYTFSEVCRPYGGAWRWGSGGASVYDCVMAERFDPENRRLGEAQRNPEVDDLSGKDKAAQADGRRAPARRHGGFGGVFLHRLNPPNLPPASPASFPSALMRSATDGGLFLMR